MVERIAFFCFSRKLPIIIKIAVPYHKEFFWFIEN